MDNCLEDREAQKCTSVKNYLHKVSGIDQGSAQQLNKTTTYVLVFTESSHFIL